MRIRLSDASRERFGCGEWLTYDPGRVTNREAATFQQVYGYDDTMQVANAFNAQWPCDEEGRIDFEKARTDYDVWDTVVWLALRQAGLLTARARTDMEAELAGIEYEVAGLRIAGDEDPSGGKDASSTPDRTSPT